jgi:molecular chaperone DnaK
MMSSTMSNPLSKLRHNRRLLLRSQPHRNFWPLVAAGAAAVAATYAFRALQRMSDEENPTKSNATSRSSSGSSSSSGSDRRAWVGIDVGTSDARVAIQRRDDADPFLVENREGKRHTPSCVQLTADGCTRLQQRPLGGGGDANADADVVVGSAAKNTAYRKPQLNFNGSDILMGTGTREGLGVEQRAALYSMVAGELARVVADSYGGDDRVAIGVPNATSMLEASARAAALAATTGVVVSAMVPDGVAAVAGALALNLLKPPPASTENDKPFHVLVVDVGGHAVQLAHVRVHHRLATDTLSSSSLLPVLVAERTLLRLGGAVFTDALVAHLAALFNKSYPTIDILKDDMARQRLVDAAEALKIELSAAVTQNVNLPFLSADAKGPKHLLCDVSRSDFEQLIARHLDEIDNAVAAFARETAAADKGARFLLGLGGGCRIPAVRRRLAAVGATLGKVDVVELHSIPPEEINAVGIVARAIHMS